jgi:hypothetical protein
MLLNTEWLIDRYIGAFNCKNASGEATDIAGEIQNQGGENALAHDDRTLVLLA